MLLLVAFVLLGRAPSGDRALVDVSLLARRSVASSSAVLFLSGRLAVRLDAVAAVVLPDPCTGTDALAAALLLIPQGVGALLSRTLAGTLTDSIGARVVAIGGFVVMGAATVPFALADAGTNEWWLMAVLLVRGFGMGAVMIPVMSVAFLGLDRAEVPHASIITRLAQQIGGAFGTALLAVILRIRGGGAHDRRRHRRTASTWRSGGRSGFTVVAIVICLALPSRPPAANQPTDQPRQSAVSSGR